LEIAPYLKDKSKPNKVDEAARILRLRKNVIEELLSTEQTYVTVLNTVSQIVLSGTNDNNQKKPVINADKQKRLFLNWQSILNCHQKILEEMMDTDSLLDLAQHVGSILMGSRKNTFLELYRYYINNFDHAHNEFVHLKNTSSTFTKWLAETEEKLAAVKIAGSGLTLEGFLIMPVQRIPRYVMLIDSLIKYSSDKDIGYNDLVRAHEQFQSIATLINESKRKVEQLEEVKKICAQIYGFSSETLLSSPDVRLIKSGDLFQKKKNMDRKFFTLLLPDRFILTSPVEKRDKEVDHTKFKYKLCAAAQMKDLRFYLDQTREKLSLKIDIMSQDASVPEKHYRLYNESDQEIQQWNVTN